MTFSTNSLERLELLQQHRRENNQFWADERLERETLTHQQRQEVHQLPESKLDFVAKATLMRRHISQDIEFRALSDGRQRHLRDRHEQELLDLTERQSKDGTAG